MNNIHTNSISFYTCMGAISECFFGGDFLFFLNIAIAIQESLSVGDVTGNVCDLVFNYFLYVLSPILYNGKYHNLSNKGRIGKIYTSQLLSNYGYIIFLFIISIGLPRCGISHETYMKFMVFTCFLDNYYANVFYIIEK
ncbi:hypothetical protein ACJX0J_023833 [Zea mays]